MDNIENRKAIVWDKTMYGNLSIQTNKHVIETNDRTMILKNEDISNTPFKTFSNNVRHSKFNTKDLKIGQRIGKYVISGFIGKGNFSNIYEAKHIYLNSAVALKTLYNSQDSTTEIFLKEAQSLATLSHESVVKVYDADVYDETPCIVLEHLIGETLDQSLSKFKKLSYERVLDLLEELASVLIMQEGKNILHLDIKPSNIFCRNDGTFCLFDYGISEVGRNRLNTRGNPNTTQFLIGTPAYMAPEQFYGNGDHRSDLFSLGLTAWVSLTGKQARDFSKGYGSIIDTEIHPISKYEPNIPKQLEKMILHLTNLNQDLRYQTAVEFYEELIEYRYQTKEPQGPTMGSAFIAIPFSDEFNQTFQVITNALRNSKLKTRRLDQHIFFDKDIWNQCIQEIETAKVIIADFSEIKPSSFPNPNVITEAAHARAINKPLIIIKQGNPDEVPFDWRYVPIVSYEKTEIGLQKLTIELQQRISQVLKPKFHF